ncbi:hypothetical protein OFN63_25020, partial [Escherichia coli]|nr:hypothetical protein [Escherichia coli]
PMAPLGSSKAELHPESISMTDAKLPLDKMRLYLEASINFLDSCLVSKQMPIKVNKSSQIAQR